MTAATLGENCALSSKIDGSDTQKRREEESTKERKKEMKKVIKRRKKIKKNINLNSMPLSKLSFGLPSLATPTSFVAIPLMERFEI